MTNKMMIKRIVPSLSILSMTSLAFACAQTNETYVKQNDRLYFLNPTLQDDAQKKRFTIKDIRKDQLSHLGDVRGFYKSNIMVGGFGEGRKFYAGSLTSKSNATNYHMGYDVLVEPNTKVLAPANGEIISAWWYAPANESIASGVGGEILIRVKIDDLKIDDSLKEFMYIKNDKKNGWVAKVPKVLFSKSGRFDDSSLNNNSDKTNIKKSTKEDYESYLNTLDDTRKNITINASTYVYLFFMHLSRNTIDLLDSSPIKKTVMIKDKMYNQSMAHIDVTNPKKVNVGDVIGYVGNSTENGGWTSHVHLEAYAFAPGSYGSRPFLGYSNRGTLKQYRITGDDGIEKSFSSIYRYSKAMGTYQMPGNIDPPWVKYQIAFNDYVAKKYQAIDANDIYKLYDSKTPTVNVKI